MSANDDVIGSITVTLLAQVGDSPPQRVGDVRLPLRVANTTGTLQASIKDALEYVSEDLKRVFADPPAGGA